MLKVNKLLSLREELKANVMKKEYDQAANQAEEMENLLAAGTEAAEEELFLSFSALAKLYSRTRNYDKAADFSRQALRLAKSLGEDQMEAVIDAHLEYAALEREYQQFAEARRQLANLLQLLEKRKFNDDFAHGMIYSSLGKVSLDEENLDGASRQLKQALDFFGKAVPMTHPASAQTADMLSDVYIQMENHQKALELNKEILKEHQQAENRQAEGRTLLKIGEIYFYIDLKQAHKTIRQAMKLLTDIHGDKHLDIAQGNLMLGELDENMGKYPRSLKYYQRALESLETFYTKDHFMIAYAYSKVGTLSIKAGEMLKAKEHLEKGLELTEKFPKLRLQFLHALGEIYSNEKRYEDADRMYREFLDILDKDGRKKSQGYADTLQVIAFNELDQEKWEDAVRHYEEALEIYEQLKPIPPQEAGLTCMRLGHSYENKPGPSPEKAETYYERGYKLLEKTKNRDILQEAVTGLIEFYSRHPNEKKRKKYEDKFVKLQKTE
ncbi:tetratricopeptide repeat protein [Virgibacillus xinjiangensis]|uniref:Tetratricopeptide repeat protein n=1 Tax=Virgibacillus xinjiangensis TaxID=393090 RepID=A0ABV7CW68_9BACI